MKVHRGGGGFQINPEYIDERKQYFYCSSDLGKTWARETGRMQTPPDVLPPATDDKLQITKPSYRPPITLFCSSSTSLDTVP